MEKQIRDKPVFLSLEVWRALLIIAKSRSIPGRLVTADEMADTELRARLTERYPDILKHITRLNKAATNVEKKLICKLQKDQTNQ